MPDQTSAVAVSHILLLFTLLQVHPFSITFMGRWSQYDEVCIILLFRLAEYDR